jgi:hypothetical protein
MMVSKYWREMSPEEKVAAIIEVNDGVSASKIATRLSAKYGKVSRNAVIGVYHRSALVAKNNKRPDPLEKFPLQRRVARPKVHKPRVPRVPREPKKASLKQPKPELINPALEDEYANPPSVVEMMRTDDHGEGTPMYQTTGCMWPTGFGSGSHLFCNEPVENFTRFVGKKEVPVKGTYCHHHRKASNSRKPLRYSIEKLAGV